VTIQHQIWQKSHSKCFKHILLTVEWVNYIVKAMRIPVCRKQVLPMNCWSGTRAKAWFAFLDFRLHRKSQSSVHNDARSLSLYILLTWISCAW
jgi:hypothetical protein